MPTNLRPLAAAFLALLSIGDLRAAHSHFVVASGADGAWPAILGSIGIRKGAPAGIFIVRDAAPGTAEEWRKRAEHGGLLVIEGATNVGQMFGFQPTTRRVSVRGVTDSLDPQLDVVWAASLEVPEFRLPEGSRVLARERWEGIPLLAALRVGKGGVLWMAASPGDRGYERFPYLLQGLEWLGLEPPFESRRLWAFFDSSYRLRVDVDYFAERWRKAGIGALHIAAWHYNEPDPARDAWLARLIEACHRQAILVYAWIELPHVSEAFWQQHPEWREKTALGQDAHLDWRKLMNLNNPDCRRAVSRSVRDLVARFDWDGVNLGELYFESLEGHANPARFTPFNADVRREFQERHGIDPTSLFQFQNAGAMDKFLDFRAELAARMQRDWIAALESIRRQSKPHLDLVLTHIDDRYDTRMRALLGADAARLLPVLEQHDMTFLIEDPATVWHLGPERYPQIAAKYQPLTRKTERLAIDINIVDRYQDVYPTKQQTGTELFQLVQLASGAFARVALYFESSIRKPDWSLLASSAAGAAAIEEQRGKLVVESPRGVGLRWHGPAKVNGRDWPAAGSVLWLPAGRHAVEPAATSPALRLVDFNGDLLTAETNPTGDGFEFSYRSTGRAIAILNAPAAQVEIDGSPVPLKGTNLLLPRGQHLVTLKAF